MRPIAWLAVATCVLLHALSAQAYEGQLSFGPQAGYAVLLADSSLNNHGLALGATGSYGLDDTWTLRANGMYAYHPGSEAWHASMLGVEIIYLLDILEWVPFIGIGGEGLVTVIDSDFKLNGAANLIVGLDYMLARDMVIGLDIRPIVVFSSLDELPAYLTATLRFEWLFDTW